MAGLALDDFLDRFSGAGCSYGITTYVEEDGQRQTQGRMQQMLEGVDVRS